VENINYSLARNVLESVSALPITKDEFDSIKLARDGLLGCLSVEQKYDLVLENYLEFEKCLLELSAKYMVLGQYTYVSFQADFSIVNRRIMNLLTACRTYIDHVKHDIKKLIKLPSLDFNINDEFAKQYDAFLGYRTCEALRNHVQHRALPVHTFGIDSSWDDHADDSALSFVTAIYLDTDLLREEGEFKSTILNELESLGRKFDLKKLLREYIEGIGEVHISLRFKIDANFSAWKNLYLSQIDRYKNEFVKEQSSIGLIAQACLGDSMRLEKINIFTGLIELREHLVKKNPRLNKLSRRYVSSKVTG
jgi:hypothetical protein